MRFWRQRYLAVLLGIEQVDLPTVQAVECLVSHHELVILDLLARSVGESILHNQNYRASSSMDC